MHRKFRFDHMKIHNTTRKKAIEQNVDTENRAPKSNINEEPVAP